jgi:signal transduction histidine kinase
VNRATRELWREPFESIIGSRLPDETPGLPWAAMLRAAAQARTTGSPATLQEHDDVAERYWDVTAGTTGATAEERRSVIVFARDVSDIVELRESLRRNERLSVMGALVSGVAHQVRNSLFAISAAVDACEAEYRSLPGMGEYTEALRTASARLARLMTNLLQFGKTVRTTREAGSLADVVASAVASCRMTAREAGVTIAVSVPTELPLLALDEGRLQAALHNLIENAVQHSARDGQVRVTVRREDGNEVPAIVCDVEDDGPGFRAGDERHLFEPFFSRHSNGTGLGMAIAQRIALEHGGRISAGNRPGGGACVTIALPFAGAEASQGESGV